MSDKNKNRSFPFFSESAVMSLANLVTETAEQQARDFYTSPLAAEIGQHLREQAGAFIKLATDLVQSSLSTALTESLIAVRRNSNELMATPSLKLVLYDEVCKVASGIEVTVTFTCQFTRDAVQSERVTDSVKAIDGAFEEARKTLRKHIYAPKGRPKGAKDKSPYRRPDEKKESDDRARINKILRSILYFFRSGLSRKRIKQTMIAEHLSVDTATVKRWITSADKSWKVLLDEAEAMNRAQ